ncbi:hypothetical protein Nepgr_019636 [Nepenthes gracilis]|uniref:Uncharacterized protein n=1 Tax=Nepenthes gracilis TaxID=150966 RepID=A0AAD3STX1_NEPGR|nr:hypothetical protein Nepgr_019636 [Nepenthes gracilis]
MIPRSSPSREITSFPGRAEETSSYPVDECSNEWKPVATRLESEPKLTPGMRARSLRVDVLEPGREPPIEAPGRFQGAGRFSSPAKTLVINERGAAGAGLGVSRHFGEPARESALQRIPLVGRQEVYGFLRFQELQEPYASTWAHFPVHRVIAHS